MKKIKRYLNILLIATAGVCATFAFAGEKTVEEGEADVAVWSGYFWPLREGKMVEPLAKYDSVTGKQAAAWERENNPSGENVPQWHGYCHGWSSSAIMDPEPTSSVSYLGRSFDVGDQKGLLAARHSADVANIYGRRFRGAEHDDINDIRPEELWTILRRYLGEQRVPLVVDFEPGEQVWNYPVFKYRVEYEIENDVCVGKMTLWYAGGASEPNFVGLKEKRAEFAFSIDAPGGLVEYGSGEWLGENQEYHPDFAWSPYVVRAESPEIDDQLVMQILQGDAPDSEEQAPEIVAEQEPESVAEQELESVERQIVFVEAAIALLRDHASDWNFDVAVDRGDGGYYEAGSPLVVSGKSERDGFLYLFGIGPNNELYAMYPLPGVDNRVKANQEFQVPGDGAIFCYEIRQPYGRYRLRAFVSEKPVEFEFTPAVSQEAVAFMFDNWDDFKVRFVPTLEKLIAERLSAENTAKDEKTLQELKTALGGFAQDEVVFVLLNDENMERLNEMNETDETKNE